MKTDLLLNIQQTLAKYLEPSDLLDAVLALLPQLGADFGSVVAQTGDGSIYFRSTLPGQEDLLGPAGRRFARKLLAEGLEGRILRGGQPEVVEDLSADPRRYRAAYLIDGCCGAAFLPFSLPRLQGQGVLILGSERPAAFSPADLPLLQAVARHIGFALESTLLYRIQHDSTTQLSLINEVSRAATSILNTNLMLTTVAQAIQRSFGFHSVRIYRQMPDAPLTLVALTDLQGRTVLPARETPAPSPFVERAVAQSQTLVANDVKADPAYSPPPEGRKIRSRLAIPIKLGAKVVGAMELDSTRLDAFPPSLVAAMETLSDQLAVAMENALLYDELNQTINELLALNRITQSVSASLDFQQTLTLITRHVTAMLNVAATSVVLRDDDAGEVWFAAAWGEGAKAVLGRRLPLGEGIVGWVAQHGKPLIVPDVRDDPRFYPEMDRQSGFHTQSILCVPLQSKGRLIGAIEAMNKLDGGFTEHDLNRLTALTAPAATAIEHAQLYRQLAQRMAQVDALRAFNQNVIENITNGLIALDGKGTITVCNKAAAALLGLRADEVIGQPVDAALRRFPQLADALARPLCDPAKPFQQEMEIDHWDGSRLTVAVTTAAMPGGVVGLLEDLTALKTLEAERRRLDRLAVLGEMSAVVAHELRNPIAGIAAGVNYLTRQPTATPEDRQAGQMILKEVERVHRIVEDILLIARPLKLNRESQPLPPLLQTVCDRQRPALQKANIRLSLTLPDDLPSLPLDRARMEQVLHNLLDNAIHAMPEGGAIRITAEHDPAAGEVILRVQDTGPGIAAAEPQQIFEPFFTTKTRGTGLGLALSRRIVEAHGGSISIASGGEGATFEIRLPTGNRLTEKGTSP